LTHRCNYTYESTPVNLSAEKRLYSGKRLWIGSQLNMRRVVYHVMDTSEIKQRLELALRPTEEPTLGDVLEQVSRHGVLRGSVDWVSSA
jgi:hypothetical protein